MLPNLTKSMQSHHPYYVLQGTLRNCYCETLQLREPFTSVHVALLLPVHSPISQYPQLHALVTSPFPPLPPPSVVRDKVRQSKIFLVSQHCSTHCPTKHTHTPNISTMQDQSYHLANNKILTKYIGESSIIKIQVTEGP